MDWRGAMGMYRLAPLVRTPISSQQLAPVNTPDPKSMEALNTPLVTGVALLATGPATIAPPSLA